MKYIFVLSGTFQTDGDFFIDIDYFGEPEFKKHISHDEGSNYWYINLKTEDAYYLRDFLEELIISIRTRTHYWLIPELYNFIVAIKDIVFDDAVTYSRRCIGGNYEKTELTLRKILKE